MGRIFFKTASTMRYSQGATDIQFYLYGKRHNTETGYLRSKAKYEEPDLLQQCDLKGRVFIVTGANSGVGFEIAKFLAAHGAKLFMFCRSPQRAEAARTSIIVGIHDPSDVVVIKCDTGLESDTRAAWAEFASQSTRLDGLVCNAGALLKEKNLTSEGLEATFASHLLHGTYLLGSLALPMLESTPNSRLIAVSSGGMYKTAFPSWEVASGQVGDYDGEKAYCYAKRAQVLLMERWATEHPAVKCVSAHPGWTSTPGVDAAFDEDIKSLLQPLRTPWQGAEGITWLCVADTQKIDAGGFYLDRSPCIKHMAGPFFTEGSYTKNTTEEVDAMMSKLDEYANRRPSVEEQQAAVARTLPLTASGTPLEIESFMGRWYVLGGIPTVFEKGAIDPIEDYELDSSTGSIQITFSYCTEKSTKRSELLQRAKVVNEANTEWGLSPKLGVYLPVSLPYLVVDCAEDYSTSIVGMPDRNYLWIMARTPVVEDRILQALVDTAVQLGYDRDKIEPSILSQATIDALASPPYQ